MRTTRSLRRALLVTAAVFGTVAGVAAVERPAYAQEAARTYNIRAQSLDGALRDFGLQSGRDVLYAPGIVAGKRSPGARGAMTEGQALSAVLAGSGLRFERTASGGYAVSNGGAPASDDRSDPQGTDEAVNLPEILVSGQRSLNVDIRRTEDDVQPYVVFSGEDLQRSGAANADEFLRQRLPMNAQQYSSNQTGLFGDDQRGGINLRGLGPDETLILVDGRRVPNAGATAGFSQPYISGIPLAAIERIEILPTTAGGIYGGSATGGVVNVVLKRDYSGWDLTTVYGNAFDSDVGRTDVSLAGGFSLENGRTRVTLNAARRSQNALALSDRDYVRRGRELALSNSPTFYDGFSLAGSTPNICSTTLASPFALGCSRTAPNLTLDAAYGGASLNSPYTFVPEGYQGVASDNGAGLVSNAGRRNLDPHRQELAIFGSEGYSLGFDVRREFTDRIDGYLSLSQDWVADENRFGQSIVLNLPANNPYNPFQQNIVVNLPLPADNAGRRESGTFLGRTGVIVTLPRRWMGSLEYSRSSTAFDLRQPLLAFGDGTTVPAMGAALVYLQSLALRDTNTAEIDFSALDRRRYVQGPIDTRLDNVALRLSGPILQLPAGPLTVSGLLEWRRQIISDAFSGYTATTLTGRPDPISRIFPERSEDVRSYYVEARAPIVSPTMNMALIHDLEVTAAVRGDRYEHRLPTGSISVPVTGPESPVPPVIYQNIGLRSTDYTIGVRYMPVQDLTLRASYGTGFLPPSLNQYTPLTQIAAPILSLIYRDPLRANTNLPVGFTLTTGGNLALQPEESESLAAGLIFNPRFLNGLRVSLDYTKIRKTAEIFNLEPLVLLANEAQFPGRVTRGPLTSSDLALGYTGGPITALDASLINVAATTVEAWDLQFDYNIDTAHGTFRPYIITTHQSAFARQTVASLPELDSTGFADGPLTWRGNLGLDWRSGAWTVNWNTQYYDSYRVCRRSDPASLCTINALARGSEHIPSQTYSDLLISYDFADSTLRSVAGNTSLALGIENIFDQQPPLVTIQGGATSVLAGDGATTLQSGSTSSFGDVRGRRFTLTLRSRF